MADRASLAEFTWDREHRRLMAYSELFGGSFPTRIIVTSHHTGQAMGFRPLGHKHPLFDQDGWDAERMVYESEDRASDILLILEHAY